MSWAACDARFVLYRVQRYPCSLFKLVKVLQPCQNHLLARFFNLTRQEDLVKDGVHFVEVEDKVKLANVAKEGVENLNKEMDCFEICQLVVVCVDTDTEEEAGVTAVDNLVVAELDKVGLVLLVAWRNESVDLALELYFLFVCERGVPFRQARLASGA